MSAQTIAWWAVAAFFAVAVALEATRRYIARRNAPLSASEWLELMRKLPPSIPPRRTQEAKPEIDLDAEFNEWMREEGKGRGGYGSQGDNRARENSAIERIWFSPHCISGKQGSLFA